MSAQSVNRRHFLAGTVGALAAAGAGRSVCAARAGGLEIRVRNDGTARPAGPLHVALPKASAARMALVDLATNRPVPCQLDASGNLWWWQGPLKPNETRRLRVDTTARSLAAPQVAIDESDPAKVQVKIGDKPFTTYCCAKGLPRPFLYPVLGPGGLPMTRSYPMRGDVSGERHDHPHHRSCWVSHGDVNKANYWHEKKGNQDTEHHRRLTRCGSGPVFGCFEALIEWCTAAGKRQLTEHRKLTFYAADGPFRMFDMAVRLVFTDGDVKFGDTKEGGMCSFRVAATMRENNGGHIRNSLGAKGSNNCWGKPAPWVDYCGPVAGQTVGITIMDGPANFRHPTTWHVRDYGLFTANPFGLSYFQRSKKVDGSHTWKGGEVVVFNYRILLHRDDTDRANVAGHYANFTRPPTIEK